MGASQPHGHVALARQIKPSASVHRMLAVDDESSLVSAVTWRGTVNNKTVLRLIGLFAARIMMVGYGGSVATCRRV